MPQGEEGGATVDEQLDAQAKAPPSATLPPGMSSSNGNNSNTTIPQNSNGGGGKGRLMGSVFTRRGNAHNQNSTGIERTVEVAASYPPSHYSQESQQNVVPMPGEDLTYMNPASSGDGYYGQQQQHGHHGPPPPQQPMYMQQQHQNQQKLQPQHVIPNSQQYYKGNNDNGSLFSKIHLVFIEASPLNQGQHLPRRRSP